VKKGAGVSPSKAAKTNQVNNQRNAQTHRITGHRANSWDASRESRGKWVMESRGNGEGGDCGRDIGADTL